MLGEDSLDIVPPAFEHVGIRPPLPGLMAILGDMGNVQVEIVDALRSAMRYSPSKIFQAHMFDDMREHEGVKHLYPVGLLVPEEVIPGAAGISRKLVAAYMLRHGFCAYFDVMPGRNVVELAEHGVGQLAPPATYLQYTRNDIMVDEFLEELFTGLDIEVCLLWIHSLDDAIQPLMLAKGHRGIVAAVAVEEGRRESAVSRRRWRIIAYGGVRHRRGEVAANVWVGVRMGDGPI